MINLQFGRTLFAFTFFGAFTDLQMTLFSALPGPLSNLYNQTFIRHYGIELDSTMLSTIPSLVSMSTAIGVISSVVWIMPLMDTRGRKFVAVQLRCLLGLASCAFQGFGGWIGSAELFVVGQLLLGLSIPIKIVVVSLFVTECAPDKHRGFASVALHLGDVLASLLISPLLNPNMRDTKMITGSFMLFSNTKFLFNGFILRYNRYDNLEPCDGNHEVFCRAKIEWITSYQISDIQLYWMCLPTVLGSNSNWPIVPGIALVLCLLMYVFTVSIPDSPKWLVRNGEKVRAAEALRFYHGTEEDPDKVMTSLCLETQLTSTKSLTIKEAWHDEAIKEAMKVIMVLQLMFISASPIPLERMYSVVIHTSVGLTVEQSLMLSWLSTLVVTPLTFLSTIAIDRFGRRPVVFVAATIIFCKILIMFSARLLVFFISPSWITMLMATVNEFASDLISCTGAGAVASLLIAELVPPAARVAVAQVLLFVPLVSTLPTMTAFPVVNALFAPAIYIPMLICQPFLVGYLIKNLPETKIRPVYEIVHNFEEEVRSRANTRHSISERTPLLKSRSGSIRSANGVPIVV